MTQPDTHAQAQQIRDEQFRVQLETAREEAATAWAAANFAFAVLYETIRAAVRAGRPVTEICKLIWISNPGVYRAMAMGTDEDQDLPCGDTDLLSAAFAALDADDVYLAARMRRDALVREARESTSLLRREVAAAAGLTPQQVRVLVRDPGYNPTSKRGRALRGAGISPRQKRARHAEAARRAAVKAGLAQPTSHGITGYVQGCRCEVCRAGMRAYDARRPRATRPDEE